MDRQRRRAVHAPLLFRAVDVAAGRVRRLLLLCHLSGTELSGRGPERGGSSCGGRRGPVRALSGLLVLLMSIYVAKQFVGAGDVRDEPGDAEWGFLEELSR